MNIIPKKKYGKDINIIRQYYNPTKRLLFELEYLNGESKFKGKEYWNDKLVFEHEYLYREKNGKGKDYDFVTA